MKNKTIDKSSHSEQNLYQALFENHPNPIIAFHRDTLKLLSANNAAAKFYGYSIEELLKLTVLDIRPEEEKQKFLEYHKSSKIKN